MRFGLNWSPERVSVGEEGEGQSMKRGRDRKGKGIKSAKSGRKNESRVMFAADQSRWSVQSDSTSQAVADHSTVRMSRVESLYTANSI